jgi:DNA-directed RNA polymerase subunit RPC12/RpoP
MDNNLEAKQLATILESKPVGVKEKEREGVFVNGFICQRCGLHFNLFSWKANRHRTDNTYCPECGNKGAFIHYRKALTNSRSRDNNSRDEIFRHVPLEGSQLMADSIVIPK